jgi:hypothetical protein
MHVGGEPQTPATSPPLQLAPVPVEQDVWGPHSQFWEKKISCPQRKSHTGPSDPQRGHTTPTASELNTFNETQEAQLELTVSSVHTIMQCVRK